MRNWFTTDLGWKLFSVLLAMGIWMVVHKILGGTESAAALVGGEKQVTYDHLPVLVVSRAADVRLFRVVPNSVSATVSGTSVTLSGLQSNQIHAVVDLTGIESARDLSRPVDVSLPAGVRLVNLDPSKVNVIVPPPAKKP